MHGGDSVRITSAPERRALLILAREAVAQALAGQAPPEIVPELSFLTEPRGAFVTIRHPGTGQLRGCRGEFPARRPLPECVRNVAVVSALEDLRFSPLAHDELPVVRFEISALAPPDPIDPEDVIIGRHGLVLTGDGGAGLLLPQVPVAQGWDRKAFLDGLCVKAGLPVGAWKWDGVLLQAFEAEVWEEQS